MQQSRLRQAECDEADEKEPTGKQAASTVYRLLSPDFPKVIPRFLMQNSTRAQKTSQ